QNCNIFNDHAFTYVTDKEARKEEVLYLEHGKPAIFGDERKRGLRLRGTGLEVFDLADGGEDEAIVWDETQPSPAIPFLMSQVLPPFYPTPIGVFRAVDDIPYETGVIDQIEHETQRRGPGKLEQLLYSGDTWEVGAGERGA
ncbi:MAG: 2-oxoacid:ferredoxin oxidoreductase subunit beta, partial [Acidobacteria bacterium]|nr:2-oxoacid:ferredoxin oxidoreductase subunit beta [Acidobacteriota bacterium]